MAACVLLFSRMAQISTRQFGALEYDEGSVIEFPVGLPGFVDQTRFVLVQRAAQAPIVCLQSLCAADLCFLAVPVGAIDPGYELAMTTDDLRLLGLNETRPPRIGDEVLCLALLTAPRNGLITANLLAPVVIEVGSRRAVQAVRGDRRYSHQHRLGANEGTCS